MMGETIVSITSEAHRTCPACATVVRPNQVRVRSHRLSIVLYALVVPAGVFGFWVAYELGLLEPGRSNRRSASLVAVLVMLPFFLLAWFLPKIRVVRCPTCACERRVRLESRRR